LHETESGDLAPGFGGFEVDVSRDDDEDGGVPVF
jgi:hypothetical protein